jgi:hypothetical protein
VFADLITEPQLARAYKRTAIVSSLIGLAGLAGLAADGYALAGLGLCIGMFVGVVNLRLVQTSVARVAASGHVKPRRPLALHTFVRLAGLTAVAIGMLVFKAPVGVGMLVGMMIFQFTFLANLAKAVFGAGRMS